MGRQCIKCGGEEACIEEFREKARRKDVTMKT
jgi:hypothetical protein